VPGRYAHCIVDLAGRWTKTSTFSMALTEDGRQLYVVDATSGSLSVIDGLTQKVIARRTFTGKASDGATGTSSAVVSADGSRLYATASRGIAAISTSDASFRRWLAPDLAVSSLAIARDGTRLYALAGGRVRVLDTASGVVADAALADATGARAVHVIAAR
jgi:DNA-binding beta-propeller fold protein YncE